MRRFFKLFINLDELHVGGDESLLKAELEKGCIRCLGAHLARFIRCGVSKSPYRCQPVYRAKQAASDD